MRAGPRQSRGDGEEVCGKRGISRLLGPRPASWLPSGPGLRMLRRAGLRKWWAVFKMRQDFATIHAALALSLSLSACLTFPAAAPQIWTLNVKEVCLLLQNLRNRATKLPGQRYTSCETKRRSPFALQTAISTISGAMPRTCTFSARGEDNLRPEASIARPPQSSAQLSSQTNCLKTSDTSLGSLGPSRSEPAPNPSF